MPICCDPDRRPTAFERRAVQGPQDREGRRRGRHGLHLRRRRRTPAVHSAWWHASDSGNGHHACHARGTRSDHGLQSRHARAGRRDSRHRRERRGGRPEVGPRLLQQQAGLDVRHQDAEADQDDRCGRRPAGRHSLRCLQRQGLHLQSPDEGRDGDRFQRRHRARHDRSGRRAGAGRCRRQRAISMSSCRTRRAASRPSTPRR